MKTILAVALATMLAGCSSVGIKSDAQKIEASCAIASASINALAVANTAGKLNAQQRDAVSKAIATITPVCNPGTTTPPTMDDVKRLAFAQAVAELQSRAAGIH